MTITVPSIPTNAAATEAAATAARGRFITFEGIDGAGKSTQIAWFAGRLAAAGHTPVLTREPGGTPLGEQLREILLHQPMHLDTEALLMFASRREHIARVIEPALARGDWVISDRFTDATFAYQGGGRGLARERLDALEAWVHPHLQPDLTLLFDLPVEVARARLAGTRALDKFEQQNSRFFEDTRDEYLRRAAATPGRFFIVDATQTPDDIKNSLEKLISSLCK